MKKTLLYFIFIFSIQLTHAEILLIEDFDYSSSTAVLTDNNWFTEYKATSSIQVTTPLEFACHPNSNSGYAALLDKKESNQLHKIFNKTCTEGNIYCSFLIKPSIISKEGYFISLRDENVGNQTFNFNARVFINTNNQLGLTFSNNANKIYSNRELNTDSTYLIVVKYSIVEGINNDNVSLYIFDNYEQAKSEPLKPEIGPMFDTNKTDINPKHIVLRSFDNDLWLIIDAIRVGTTWEDVVPETIVSTNPMKYDIYNLFSNQNILHIEMKENNYLTIYDIVGNIIYSKMLYKGIYTFDMKDGIYIIKANNQINKIQI